MSVLPKILNDLKIKSSTDFMKCMHNDHAGPLSIIGTDKLEMFFSDYVVKENEVHGDSIEFNNLILDVKQLSFFPKAGIVFRNCIFTGKILLNGRGCNDASIIEMENCIFLDELIITGFIKMNNKNISIFHTNIACLSLFNIKASELILTGCRIFFLSIHKIETKKFEADNNYFKHFEIESSKFGEVLFDHRQIDLDSMGKRIIRNLGDFRFKTYSKLSNDINLFLFIPYKTSVDLQRSESYNAMLQTVDFLKNSTSLSFDRNKYMQLMYYDVLLAQDNSFHKAFIRITGGFLKPLRFISIAVIVFALFAAFYMIPVLEFKTAQNGLVHSLPIDQALYFSGITFTTIGYGDICPVGFSRVLAILEGIFGISITSGLLVALVKKYLD